SRSTGRRRRRPLSPYRQVSTPGGLRPKAGWYLDTHQQDVIETRANVASKLLFLHHLRPVEEKVNIIEHVLPLLGLDIVGEQSFEFAFPLRAPGKIRSQYLGQGGFGVDNPRVDREASILGGKALFGFR